MNITIPSNATTQSIKAAYPVPRGATHFRLTTQRHKAVIDSIKNLDTIAGCTGKFEYGKVTFQGRGRHAKIVSFTALSTASVPVSENKPEPITIVEEQPVAPATDPVLSKVTKLNRIMGFSACAVAKALGKAGVKYTEADRILRAHGIEMPKASLSVQLGFGRNAACWERRGQPADLNEAQIAELRTEAAQ